MSETYLASMHEDALYAEQRKRAAFGIAGLLASIVSALIASAWLIHSPVSTTRFTFFLVGLGVDLYVIFLIMLWTTQPLQERARRKKLVRRQALGVIPCEDE